MTPTSAGEFGARGRTGASAHTAVPTSARTTVPASAPRAERLPGTWRLLAPAVAGWVVSAGAVTLPGSGVWIAWGAVTVGSAATSVVALRGHRGRVVLALVSIPCAVLLVLGARVSALEAVRSDPGFSSAAERGSSVNLDVTLRGFPRHSPGANGALNDASRGGLGGWVLARAASSSGAMPVVLWYGSDAAKADLDSWAPGTRLRITGALVALGPASSAAYGVRVSSIQNVPATAPTREHSTNAVEGPGNSTAIDFTSMAGALTGAASATAAQLRAGLRAVAATVPGAQLVPGFAVGDTSLVPAEVTSKMEQSSLTHLVAVSGANCALVVSAIAGVAALCRIRRRGRLVVSGLTLGAFVVVVGPDPSLQRAAVMASVMLISGYGGKRNAALPSLGIAILILLLIDPWQALQPGFALSVAATAGILLWAPAISSMLSRIAPAPRWALLPVAVAIAAQFACGPLLLLVQDGFPAAGLLANVLAAPAAPWGTGLGLLAMLAAPISTQLAEFITTCAAFPARWIAATAQVTAALPASRWPWPGGWGGAALLAVVEGLVLVAWWVLRERVGEGGPRATAPASGPRPWLLERRRPTIIRAAVAALICTATGIFVGPTLVAPIATRWDTAQDWSVVACDVGQGDALLLRDPEAPENVMLVDTGETPELLHSCLDRFGVTRIAVLVLTHDDRDHVGAADGILDRVDRALVAPNNREDGTARRVTAMLDAANVPYDFGEAGAGGALGNLSWEVLAPPPGSLPDDTNGASQVLRVQAGPVSVLLLADTGEDEQRALARSVSSLQVDVIKVAHHGSSDHDPALFGNALAEIGLVSVGADNAYGHPATSALEELRQAGTRVLRTDELGAIAVSGAPGNLRVWAERGE
ncbi:ComEC/Rec2 family competence protein [Leucobacter sp. USHLN153]|uniref:ComEC/Rec2 family competence protein n=1 Tax=Leucobacter sp. USHLN153 TaxID=3081268 RepID=UPI00301AC785